MVMDLFFVSVRIRVVYFLLVQGFLNLILLLGIFLHQLLGLLFLGLRLYIHLLRNLLLLFCILIFRLCVLLGRFFLLILFYLHLMLYIHMFHGYYHILHSLGIIRIRSQDKYFYVLVRLRSI